MTYKFKQFTVEIINPNITVKGVNDNIIDKSCTVDVLLTTEAAKFGVQLEGFTYTDTWEDADIIAWVNTKLQDFKTE